MKLTSAEEKTVDYYNKFARNWLLMHPEWEWQKELDQLKDVLPSGKILELGTGPGIHAEQIIKAGYDYLGTDISQGLLKVAKERNPNAILLQKSIYDLDFPENSFNGFWTVATLLHIPKSRIDEALKKIHYLVKNGGVGFIVIKAGKGEEIEKPEEGGERLFVYYSQDQFKKVLERNNFKVFSSRIWKKSKKTTWLIYFVSVIK